jgi:hypothetical protein
MFLDAVSQTAAEEFPTSITNGNCARKTEFAPWKTWEPSDISHHGKMCCEIAREWFTALDYSVLNGGKAMTGPRWIAQRFPWGPSSYPTFWCEVPKKKRLDCGVQAALAHEIFSSRGVKNFRAQMVQEFSPCATTQWRTEWRAESAVTDWIDHGIIYHEGCAIVSEENELKLWDASAGWWIDPRPTTGYGSLRAFRISSKNGIDEFLFGKEIVPANSWVTLGPEI